MMDQFIWWKKLQKSKTFRLQHGYDQLLLVRLTMKLETRSFKRKQSGKIRKICDPAKEGIKKKFVRVLLCCRLLMKLALVLLIRTMRKLAFAVSEIFLHAPPIIGLEVQKGTLVPGTKPGHSEWACCKGPPWHSASQFLAVKHTAPADMVQMCPGMAHAGSSCWWCPQSGNFAGRQNPRVLSDGSFHQDFKGKQRKFRQRFGAGVEPPRRAPSEAVREGVGVELQLELKMWNNQQCAMSALRIHRHHPRRVTTWL